MSQKLSCLVILTLLATAGVSGHASEQKPNSQAFSIRSGEYTMEATFKFSDADKPITGVGGAVTVTIKGAKVEIKVPVFASSIEAKLAGNSFKGKLRTGDADVEFQGEIVENDHVEGFFSGSMGKRKVYGIWTMKLSKQNKDKRTDS